MSIEQFTNTSLKPWLNIGAKNIYTQNLAVSTLVYPGGIDLNGGPQNTQPMSLSASFPNGQPTITLNRNAYFSISGNTSSNLSNGIQDVVFEPPVTPKLLNTTFDGKDVTIEIGGYYYISYDMALYAPPNTQLGDCNLSMVQPGFGLYLSTQIFPHPYGVITSISDTMISNSGIVKLLAGTKVGPTINLTVLTGGAVFNLYGSFSLYLLDPVSA